MWEASGMNSINIQSYESADISVYLQDKGLVLKERSLVAFDSVSGKIAAMGTQAEQMTQVGSILVRSPLRQGTVADYEAAVHLFAYVPRKALGRKPIKKPAVAVCTPGGMTSVERKALEDARRMGVSMERVAKLLESAERFQCIGKSE